MYLRIILKKIKNVLNLKLVMRKKSNAKFCDVKCDFTDCDYECFEKKNKFKIL